MYEEYPASYLETFQAFAADPRSERYLTTLLDNHLATTSAGAQGSFRVLDVCCGTGFIGRATETHLKSLGKNVKTTFLDSSTNLLEGIGHIETIQTICADVTAMDTVTSESYDIVVCRYGFNNLPQERWLAALSEVMRVLKPSGIFLLQDHFVPGPTFSALVNEAERFLALLEGKKTIPFIFSTEAFNAVLDEHPLVADRTKVGYGLLVNIWDRLRAKKENLPDFEAARQKVMRFYREVCLQKYKVLIVDPEEYIHVYNVTYGIRKRR